MCDFVKFFTLAKLLLVLKRPKLFSVTITLLGAQLGFLIGNFIYVLIYIISGWESIEAAISFAAFFTLVFAAYSYIKRANSSALTRTLGMVGGFLFVRGLSCLFGGYPINPVLWALLSNGMPLDDVFKPIIWLYLVLSLLFSLIFMCWLFTYRDEQCDSDLIRYFDSFDSDDSFSRSSTVDYSEDQLMKQKSEQKRLLNQ